MPGSTRVALVRPPTPSMVDGLVTHVERQPVDVDLAMSQWEAYVAAMQGAGWETRPIAADSACPDAVFIEDTAVVIGGVALICHPGDDTRKPEVAPIAAALESLGYDLRHITGPGTLDGGDVMKIGSTMYIGEGGRTNAAGIEQARQLLAPDGIEVIGVPNHKVLHLKSAVTALPDGRVIGYEPVVQDTSAFPQFVAMPEESGAHVVDLGDGRLLMAAGCPKSAELVSSFGYEPVVVDISEYEKLEGCVTCLSIRLRDLPS